MIIYTKRAGFFYECICVIPVLLGLFWLYCLYFAYLELPLGADAGYHLSVAQRVFESSPLFSTIPVHYTPLAYFVWSFFAYCFSTYIDNTSIYWWTNSLIHFLIGVSSFYFLRHSYVPKSLALFICVSMLFTMSLSEGVSPLLEPFVILPSILLLILIPASTNPNFKYFTCGQICSVSMLAKQYGIVSLFTLTAAVLVYERALSKRLRAIVSAICGFTLTTLIFFIVVSEVYSVSLSSLFSQFFLQRYDCHAIEFNRIFKYICTIAPFSALLIYMPISMKHGTVSEKKTLLILTANFLAFSLPLIKRQYLHYFMLIWPSLSLIAGLQLYIAWKQLKKGSMTSLFFFTIGIILFSLVPINYIISPGAALAQYNDRQKASGYMLRTCNEFYPRSKVLVIGDPLLMYLCNFLPSDSVSTGYAFFEFIADDRLRNVVLQSRLLLIDYSSLRTDEIIAKMRLSPDELEYLLTSHGFIKKSIPETRIYIWQKL